MPAIHLYKPKAAVCHPRLGRGGSETRAMWAIQALREDFNVTLVTGGKVDLEALNEFYGTSLRPSDCRIRQAPVPTWLSILRGIGVGDALDGAPYQGYCRRIAHEFDVLISTYNFCDFGVPAIHFVADFSWDDAVRRTLHPSPPGVARFVYEDTPVRRAYLRFARFVGKTSGHNIFAGQDLIFANSRWTAGLMRTKYGIDTEVLYPPVPGECPSVPWQQRENGFVCLGRINSAKRIETIIDILARVRQRGYDVHLHVIGRIGDDSYGRRIAALCEGHADWVIPEGAQAGKGKVNFLAAHRFGIHACNGEAFGIAVAEMVKASCIPFVPEEGGQAEIVNHRCLTYTNVDDAADKIAAVLERPQLQAELCQHLTAQGGQFSTENFMAGVRNIVQQFLARKAVHSGV